MNENKTLKEFCDSVENDDFEKKLDELIDSIEWLEIEEKKEKIKIVRKNIEIEKAIHYLNLAVIRIELITDRESITDIKKAIELLEK